MNEFKRSPVTTSNEQIFYNTAIELVTEQHQPLDEKVNIEMQIIG